ncbi:MAG: MFS transporter, partial [Actinomycetota bacterium]|nr:MFS transporter [Actinomycetota bacterium]
MLFGPARDSSIPDLVGRNEIITANSPMSTSTYLTMALGTMLATVILAFAGLTYGIFPPLKSVISQQEFQHKFAFIVDALSFFISALLLFTIAFPKRSGARVKMNTGNVYRDLKDGLHFMRTNSLTRSILGVMIIGFIGGGSLYILGAPFVQQVLKATGTKFTLILSSLLLGVVAGAATAPWLSGKLRIEHWFGRAIVGFGLIMIVFSLMEVYFISVAIIFVGGFLLGYLLVGAYSLLHQNLEENVRGRVFAAMQTIMRTCLLLSAGLFAVLGWLFGKWIPWRVDNPVFRTLNLGFMSKRIYPAMLALIIGGVIVIVGGMVSMKGMRTSLTSTPGEEKDEGTQNSAE